MVEHRRQSKDKGLKHESMVFINHDRALKDIQRALNRNISCAIIAGRWMGKTHFLRHLREMFSQRINAQARKRHSTAFIPIYFSPHTFAVSSLKDLYSQLIDDIVTEINEWMKKCYSRSRSIEIDSRIKVAPDTSMHIVLEAFEADLWEITKTVRYVVKEPKLVFLFDNLYRLNNQVITQSFVSHWFEILHKDTQRTRNLRPHIVIAVACLRDHIDQFIDSSRQQTNALLLPGHDEIRPIYLGVFERADIEKMLEVTLGKDIVDTLPENLTDELYSLSGGHPHLAKSMVDDIVHDIHQFQVRIDMEYFEKLKLNWHAYFSGIFSWIGERIIEDHMMRAIFEILVNSKRAWRRGELFEKIQKTPSGARYANEMSKALLLLQCMGVVRQIFPDSYEVSGQMCCEYLMIPKENIEREIHASTINSCQEVERQTEENMAAQQLLKQNDLRRLKVINDTHPIWRYKTAGQRRAILNTAGLPNEIIDNLQFDGTNTDTDMLLSQLENFGRLQNRPNYTALGAWLDHMLSESSEVEGALFLANLILHYSLIKDSNYLQQLEIKYGLIFTHPRTKRTSLAWLLSTMQQTEWKDKRDPATLEKIWRERAAFLDVAFLERGAQAARSVCCIEYTDGAAIGTGFLVAPNLLLTNYHVLPNDAIVANTQVRFGFRLDILGHLQRGSTYQIKQRLQFSPTDNLDYVLLELEDEPGNNPEIGYLRPVAKLAEINTPLYIIQHPQGKPQKIVLQENWITYLASDHRRIQYLTNTEYGSSGAPAFNENWDLVAIHHSRAPFPQISTDMSIEGNEGIPLITILPEIKDFLPYSVD